MKNSTIFCLLLLAAGGSFCLAQTGSTGWRRYLPLADSVAGSTGPPCLRFDPSMMAPIEPFSIDLSSGTGREHLRSVVFREPEVAVRAEAPLRINALGIQHPAPDRLERRELLEIPMILGASLLSPNRDWGEVLDRAWERRAYPDFFRHD